MLQRKKKEATEAADTKAAASLSKRLQRQTSSARRKAGGKKHSFTVFIGDEGAILVYMRGNKVLRRFYAPSPIPEHMQSIIELMQSQPLVPLSIVLDTIDQQYVKQTFPPVSALSVSKLVNRRLERDFPAEDVKGSIALGREQGGRKEWSYLLISLANTESLQGWLDVFLEMPNECKGIYLSAVEGQQFVPELTSLVLPSSNQRWQLFLSHNKVGGLRQIVLYNGRLTFTRLTQIVDESNHALTAGNIEQEIQNTIDYLRRLEFEDNRDMSMVVIASQEINEHLDLDRFGVGASAKVTPFDASNLLNVEQAALSGDRFGDVVMAAAFATSAKRKLALFTPYAKRLSLVYKARLAAKILAAMIVAYSLFTAATAALDWLNNTQEIASVNDDFAAKSAQLSQSQQSIDSLDGNTSLWSSVVALYEVYKPNTLLPFDFVRALSAQLNSDTRIIQMGWQAPVGGVEESERNNRRGGQPEEPATPMNITVDVEFTGNYENQDAFIDAAGAFFAQLQAGMQNYMISSENMPSRAEPEDVVEISFEEKDPEPFNSAENKVSFTFKGPIAVTEENAGGAL